MKYILASFLTLIGLSASSQTDTSYIINQGGVFYEVTQTLTPVGDSATIQNLYFNRATDAARQFSDAVNVTWGKQSFVDRILAENTALQDAIGKSIITVSVEVFGDQAIGDWDVILNGNPPVAATMTIAPSGNNLRLTVGGTNYNLLPVGDSWVRLMGYPDGSFTDLFRVKGQMELRSIDETVILMKQ